MNKYTNFILTVIAVVMIGILFKDSTIMNANAAFDNKDYEMVQDGMFRIVAAINGISINCN